ncbi:MAG: suppressor of fused domain protein [Nannocystaceae bacterium]|nr:suppressor of fused domain protein [Nannocystaceae bacterium]
MDLSTNQLLVLAVLVGTATLLAACNRRETASAEASERRDVAGPNDADQEGAVEVVPESGRAAIDEALDQLYGGKRDHRYGVSPQEGEQEAPLAEIVAYRASEPVPHWHYITYGLSELGTKTSADAELSGFGVEYTLRLVDDSEQPPVWPMNLLRYVAQLVRASRTPFDPKHSTDLSTETLEDVSSGVGGLAFILDTDLGSIDTPNGQLAFVNVLPLAAREWWLLGAWDFDEYADVVREQQGDLLWRVGRESVLAGPLGARIQERVRNEGSSQSFDFCELRWDEKGFQLDDVSRQVFIKFLRYRIAFGRDATIASKTRKAHLSPGTEWKTECSDVVCEIRVPVADATAFADELENAKDGTVLEKPGETTVRITSGLLPLQR